MIKKITKIFFVIFFLSLSVIIFNNIFNNNKIEEIKTTESPDPSTKSNIIQNVNYSSKDAKGNEYIIDAIEGEIDYADTNIIYLKNVKALIKLNSSENIIITSDFGKYNIENYDTIFTENLEIRYIDNHIIGEYLDFSIKRNSMIVSRNIVYTNFKNVLKADVIEIDIQTKDTKIYMYENDKKVNIKSK